MDNHPIPQDVTGFQFKLIGNMTVKQFAYLATGVILAWIFIQLPIIALIKIPLASLFALFGVGLAFVPISGRPMDLMIKNFIKALFRPTQFVYQKTGTPNYSSNTATYTPVQNNRISPPIQPPIINEPKPNPITPPPPIATPPPPPQTPAYSPPQQAPAPAPAEQKKPLVFPQQMPFRVLTASDSPNVVVGVTKDPRNNTLSNILVEVRDKDGNPIRAFKTNEIGRFASATPLINGTYTVHFEDPKEQNKFEVKTIEAKGEIIQPLEVISIDPREELRRELFSNQT